MSKIRGRAMGRMVLDKDHPVPRKPQRDQFPNTLCPFFLAQAIKQPHRLCDSRPKSPDFPAKSDIEVIDVPVLMHQLIAGHRIGRVMAVEGQAIDLPGI